MDVDGLVAMLQRLEAGQTRVHFVESTEPSVMAHEILNGKPYTFLDDAPLEERRTRAVQMRRGLPLQAAALAQLDPDAVDRVRTEAAPDLRGPEELHDLLLSLVVLRPADGYRAWFDALAATGRASTVTAGPASPAAADGAGVSLWSSVERRSTVEALFPGALFRPDHRLPADLDGGPAIDPDVAAADTLRGHLDVTGPVTVAGLAERTALAESRVKVGLARLEAEGFALQGRFDPALRRRPVVRPTAPGPDPRLHPAQAPPGDRAGHGPGLHAFPPPLAARGARRPSARDGPGSWPWSISSRASRSPPGPGRRPSSRPGSRATSPAGWRISASRASSSGAGWPCGPSPRTRLPAGVRPPRRGPPR